MSEMDFMSPTKVAEQYGGDKQKIAQAIQMGLLDPTVGVMAGMFIDRVRNAAVQEQQPQTTVAQDVMAPPQPQMPQMPSQAGLQAAAAAPMERGLAALPVDESMVPGGEGYAGGGIIAFDEGGDVDLSDPDALMRLERRRQLEMASSGAPLASNKPTTLEDFISMAQQRRSLPLSEAEQALQEQHKAAPEKAKQTKEDALNKFLMDWGFKWAGSKSPYALQAAGESGASAAPTLFAGAKEAREIEEAGKKGLAEMGKTERLEKLAGVTAGEKMYETEEDRKARERIANAPPDALKIAQAIRKPGEGLDAALARATDLTNKADKYNAISARVTGAMKAMYDSAEYDTLTRAYKNAKTEDERKAITDKMVTLRNKFLAGHEVGAGDLAFMKSFTSKYSGADTGKTMTAADVKETARKSGKTEAEVISAAKAQGYTIQ